MNRVNEYRTVYRRQNVLHICGGGTLLRAPDDTLASEKCEVILRGVDLPMDESSQALGVVEVKGRREEWLEWTPEPAQKALGKRKLYKRRGVVHACSGGKLYKRPEGSAALFETPVQIEEPGEAQARVLVGEREELWPRWHYGESTRARKKSNASDEALEKLRRDIEGDDV